MNTLLNESLKVTAIICGAGKSTRSNLKENKIFAVMPNGKTVLENAIYPFEVCPKVTQIIITANQENFEQVQKIASSLQTPHAVVLGGSTRTQSVINGVEKSNGEILLIHDGARPYITPALVEECIESVKIYNSAVVVSPCTDTVVTLDNGEIITSSRENKMLAQTPQCFYKKDIEFALSQIKPTDNFTDEAGAYCKYVKPAHPVVFNQTNKKLTYPEDFSFNNGLRVGTGFDLHQLVSGRKLILGGVEIPHDKGLLGHSDADVLLHAVMDALLSSLSLKDIGYHFSDKDEKYKDISSVTLFNSVMKMLEENGYKPNNISAVICAERPKLAPYVSKICDKIAKLAKIESNMVGITCTTLEKIGTVGREEGIAVYAYCSVKPL